MPPAWAIAIAIGASVTVSIAELSSGMFSRIDRVTRVAVSTCPGSTSDAAGTSRTSSKVSASRTGIGSPWLLPDAGGMSHGRAGKKSVKAGRAANGHGQ